ncbi:SH3 domain-containing protein [Streptomyces misionensis]|uniref:SH3 domain-containing protein n=1 Tax=Streptomyces misionensis TaxID=67331 RepID=UPI00340CD09B
MPAFRLPRSGRIGRTVAASAIALVAAAGATLAAAPTASAVGSSACTGGTLNWSGHIQRASLVNLRSGPGTSYSSYGLVSNGTRLTLVCHKTVNHGYSYGWDYVKIRSGSHAGTYGWVYEYYVYAA